MALLIVPIAVVLGWLIRSPRRAAAVTVVVGLGALVVLRVLSGWPGRGGQPVGDGRPRHRHTTVGGYGLRNCQVARCTP